MEQTVLRLEITKLLGNRFDTFLFYRLQYLFCVSFNLLEHF